MDNVPVITATQLFDEIRAGQPLFILDLRIPSEFEDWKIEGNAATQYQNSHYSLFFEEMESTLASLPSDQEITIVCAKGGASGAVAELMAEAGLKVRHLEGGMEAWSRLMVPMPIPTSNPALRFWQFNRVGKGCLSYVVASGDQALVVDPARIIEPYVQLAESEGFTIRYIVDTHVHADHISGGPQLSAATGAPYYLTPTMEGATVAYQPLKDGEEFPLHDVSVKVVSVHTPGHTPESTCLNVNEEFLISGDTLFVQSVGRPDLGGKAREWAQDLYHSVHQRLSTLDDSVWVLPAHYGSSDEISDNYLVSARLGNLRAQNAALRTTNAQDFIDLILRDVKDTTPPNYETITQINIGRHRVDSEEADELEIGPNRCAVSH